MAAALNDAPTGAAAHSGETANDVPGGAAEEGTTTDAAAGSRNAATDVPADATEEGATDDVVLGAASVPTRFSCGGDAAAASAMPRKRAASLSAAAGLRLLIAIGNKIVPNNLLFV